MTITATSALHIAAALMLLAGIAASCARKHTNPGRLGPDWTEERTVRLDTCCAYKSRDSACVPCRPTRGA